MSRSLNGALAGGIAAAVWAAQQPVDKRIFGAQYDDVELLGKAVTRGREWPWIGLAMHVGNGASFGAGYTLVKPLLPGPPLARALGCAMAENFGLWPLGALVDRYHPARRELTPLKGNYRALAQATWRHALFGVVLGFLEQRLNALPDAEPPFVPISSNGHGNLEQSAAVAS